MSSLNPKKVIRMSDEDIYRYAKDGFAIGYAYFEDNVATYEFADNSLLTAEFTDKWVFTVVDAEGNPIVEIAEREELSFLV